MHGDRCQHSYPPSGSLFYRWGIRLRSDNVQGHSVSEWESVDSNLDLSDTQDAVCLLFLPLGRHPQSYNQPQTSLQSGQIITSFASPPNTLPGFSPLIWSGQLNTHQCLPRFHGTHGPREPQS